MEKKPTHRFYKKRKFWIIAALLVVGGFIISQVTKQPEAVVETATVTRGEVREELTLSGEVKAVESASLAFGSSGNVSWVGVKSGDRVIRGQALMKLDTVKLNSAYQRALSAYRLTQASVDRVHDDLKNKGNSETFLEKETRTAAEVANDQAYEGYVSAMKDLKDATLTAPFAGTVASVLTESAGVNVVAGTPQIKIVNPTTIYFSVNADQTDVSKLKVGQLALVSLDAFDDKEMSGKITDISFSPSEVDSGTVYPVRITFSLDNSDYSYRIGMTGDASFTLSEKQEVLFVPNKFVKSDREGKYVLDSDGVTKKYVEVGIEGDDRVEIKGDIVEGQVVSS